MLQYFSILQREMEAVLFAREMEGFNRRFESIDGNIRKWEGKIPKAFDKNLINVDSRYPIDRVGFLQEKPFDRWLTNGLKEKALFFDSPTYTEKLIQFYNEVYLPLHEKEQVEELKPEPPPIQGKTDKSVLAKEDKGSDSTLFVNRHPKFQA